MSHFTSSSPDIVIFLNVGEEVIVIGDWNSVNWKSFQQFEIFYQFFFLSIDKIFLKNNEQGNYTNQEACENEKIFVESEKKVKLMIFLVLRK